jgi:transposase
MFFGSDGGGDSAAVMYSLIGSCKLNGIEPEAWLRHVISVINTWPANRVKELLERHPLCKLIFTPRPSRCAYGQAELRYCRSVDFGGLRMQKRTTMEVR